MTNFSEHVADILCNRGVACASIGDFVGALDSFREAIDRKPDLVRTHVFCHIASKVPSADTFEHLFRIWQIVHEVQKELLYLPLQAPNAVFHYTGMNTLKKLVEGGKFRLYNADYMDDPEEGKAFWNIIKKISGRDFREKIYSDESEESLSPAYVGSFVRMKDGEKENDAKDGELFLWRTYGKNAEVEAAGACLHFDISKFSKDPPSEIGRMSSPIEECIYRVVYENEINPLENKGLQARLGQLIDELIYITEKNWESTVEKEDTLRLTRELLDAVSFLFKGSHYREERELRIVQSHYTSEPTRSGEHDAEGKNEVDDRKADADQLPPRFYLEVENLELGEVTLGPRAQDVWEWKRWLEWKKSDLKIHHSKIRYGKKTR
ncbi:MAG: tetratricopeptide repeat protein [Alphaproteobacteria bacterium]|nr:tetratricopeptide repeat protein [Alphaproteobacteria bacterium]